jgi:hypothetical protein
MARRYGATVTAADYARHQPAMHQLLTIKQTPRPPGREMSADYAGD